MSTQVRVDTGRLTAVPGLPATEVVVVSHGFQSNYERGFCNGIAANGVAVTLLGSDTTEVQRLHPSVIVRNLRGSQDPGRNRWCKARNLLRYHLRLLVFTVRRPHAVVHVTGLLEPPLLCGLFEALWFRMFNRRYVLTVHDLLPHDRHSFANSVLYGLSFRLAQRVVVHTEKMRTALINRFGVNASRIVVMEHGLEADAPEHDECAAAGDRGSRIPMILAFGTIAPYKGVDLLIEALAQVDFEFRLVIAGPCKRPDYLAQLESLIARHPFRSSIELRPGYVSDGEMDALFRETALVALPYRHIDQSGVLFQALRFGVPVLSTPVGEFARYIGHEVGVVADAIDVGSVRAALCCWSARRPSYSRERIRAAGRRFEWSNTTLALAPAYQ